MELPMSGVVINPYLLILIGFCVGVLGGFFGVGGSWFVTPALNIFGFPMAFAIGTDLAHIMGKSIIATFRHQKMGNVDIKLGLLMIFGTVFGVELGKEMILSLEKTGLTSPVVRGIYIFVLGSIGSYMVYDYFRFTRFVKPLKGIGQEESLGTALSRWVLKIKIPPMVNLRVSNIPSISVWVIIFIGFATGFFAGFLGGGAGYIRMPALVYVLGVPTTVAVGTDLFEIIFSSGYGAFVYALEGKVDLIAAMIMLVGAAVGAQLGSIATRYIKSMRIRLYFGYSVLLAGVSVVLKQVGDSWAIPLLGNLAGILILALAVYMSVLIIFGLARGMWEEKRYFSHE
ncbi:MAG TPA: sulfite exporter TauE/SafE family protein [Nitrospiria bacterium]|jgi:hypothetical protein